MAFDPISAKIKSLEYLSSTYGDNLWKMIGFLLVVFGWLITSEAARGYIGTHQIVKCCALITLILSVIAWVRVCFIIFYELKTIEKSISSSIDASLKGNPDTDIDECAYSGFLVGKDVLWINVIIVIALGVMVGVTILFCGIGSVA